MIIALLVFTATAAPQTLWQGEVRGVGKVRFAKLEDGVELIHVAMPAAREQSLRLVFRAGSADEPARGLAHLLEHAVFHGDADRDAKAVLGGLRGDGARVNAFTGAESTEFVVDAPPATAAHAMRSLVALATNPALELADIEDEGKVVAVEELLRPRLTLGLALDTALFPHEATTSADEARDPGLSHVDSRQLQEFYAAHYHSSTLTVVAAGPMSFDDVASLFESESRLAPSDLDVDAAPLAGHTVLPLDLDVPSGRVAALAAFRVDGDEHVCADLAFLLRLRLGGEHDVDVECIALRSSRFVVAARDGDVLDEGALEAALQDAARRAAHVSADDLSAIAKMRAGRLALLASQPATIAEALAQVAAAREDRTARLVEILDVKATSKAALSAAAQKTFSDQNRALLRFTPFAR
jgi:zinc protease